MSLKIYRIDTSIVGKGFRRLRKSDLPTHMATGFIVQNLIRGISDYLTGDNYYLLDAKTELDRFINPLGNSWIEKTQYYVRHPKTVKDGEAAYISDETMEISKEIAKDVKAVVKDNYVIDWVTNQSKTNDIQRAIKLMIIKKYAKRIPRDVREKIMEPLLNLAKIHFDVLN